MTMETTVRANRNANLAQVVTRVGAVVEAKALLVAFA